MTSSAMRGARRGLVVAAGGIILAAGAARAQDIDASGEPQRAQLPPGAVVQPLDSGPGAELRRNLTTLSQNPRSLEALIGAGRAAAAMGDGVAALSFFARADEVSPNDPRVKAGMGSALVLMDRADQALPMFAQAISLGAPEVEIAGDRGLAYDMIGDPRRAQQDYTLALRRRADPEVERRMALSLAISGQRQAALRVIDAQLRRHDRAGWRTQAFVLALTGDARGAEDTASRLMPPANAQAMAPFFARLASLGPSQKAAAVHFGRFPSDGRAVQVASAIDTRADPGALDLARHEGRPRPQPAEPVNDPARREPPVAASIRARRDEAPPVEPRREIEVARNDSSRFAPPQPEPDTDEESKPDEVAAAPPVPVERPREAPAFVPGGNFTVDGEPPRTAPPVPQIGPPVELTRPIPQIARPAPPRATDFGDVAAFVQSLPQEEGRASPPTARTLRSPPSSPVNAHEGRGSEPQTTSRGGRNTPSIPARHWVQLAHGGSQSALPRHFADARDEAPALLGSRAPYVALTDRVNRLLVGPFDSEAAARAFVGQLDRRHVEAIAWTSPAGQEIERLRIANEPRAARSQPEPERRTAARGSRDRSTEPEPRPEARGSRGRSAGSEPRPAAREGRSRSGSEQRAGSHGSAGRRESERRTASHGARDSAAANRPGSTHGSTARPSRGRSGEEQRPPARGRRSH